MTEILIGSSMLILALLLLRLLFRRRLSQRVIYALWGFVLLRLLIPVSVPVMDLKLPSLFGSARQMQDPVSQPSEAKPAQTQTAQPSGILPVNAPGSQPGAPQPLPPSGGDLSARLPGSAEASEDLADAETANPLKTPSVSVKKAAMDRAARILQSVWIAGMMLAGGYFLLANIRFYVFLRNRRIPYATEDHEEPIWLMKDGLSSPCLFGRSVYLTPAAVASGESLRHVLAHEETHARHLDPLWSLLRCVCLTVYWFDPLIWIAAVCSKTDCELACDEGALLRLGGDERISYGHTLLSLIAVKSGAKNPFLVSTIMSGGKKRLKERMIHISGHARASFSAALSIVVLSAALTACSFAGAKKTTDETGSGTDPATIQIVQIQPTPAETYQPLPSPDDTGRAETAPTDTEQQSAPSDADLSPLVWNGELPAIPLPTENLPDGMRKLTAKELAQLNKVFEPTVTALTPQGPETYASPLSCFFTSTYEYVWNMDFTRFLMYYPAGLWDTEAVTDAEFQQIKALAGFGAVDTVQDMLLPVHRMRRDLLDAALQYYAGITTNTLFAMSSDVSYLSEYDAWYTFTSDFGAGMFHCVDGAIYGSAYSDTGIAGGGHFAILRGNRHQDGSYDQLTLVKTEEKWLIRSFRNVREPDLPAQGARALTPEEIERVNQAFAATVTVETPDGPMGSSTEISCFFTSCYTDVRELDFARFLMYHPLISPYGEEVTEAEFQLLKEPSGWEFIDSIRDMPVPIHRFRRSKVDETLMRYAGITTADLKDVSSNVDYLPEYDSWYNFTSDFGPGAFQCKRGSVYNDSRAVLQGYCNGFFGQLTLEKDGDDWHIRSLVSLGIADPYILFSADE